MHQEIRSIKFHKDIRLFKYTEKEMQRNSKTSPREKCCDSGVVLKIRGSREESCTPTRTIAPLLVATIFHIRSCPTQNKILPLSGPTILVRLYCPPLLVRDSPASHPSFSTTLALWGSPPYVPCLHQKHFQRI